MVTKSSFRTKKFSPIRTVPVSRERLARVFIFGAAVLITSAAQAAPQIALNPLGNATVVGTPCGDADDCYPGDAENLVPYLNRGEFTINSIFTNYAGNPGGDPDPLGQNPDAFVNVGEFSAFPEGAGLIKNYGVLVNEGAFTNTSRILDSHGVLQPGFINAGSFLNNGVFNNSLGLTTNKLGATLINSLNAKIGGVGFLYNNGDLTNLGDINTSAGLLTASGPFSRAFLTVNNGNLTNEGSMRGGWQNTGLITNGGTFTIMDLDNAAGGRIDNLAGGLISWEDRRSLDYTANNSGTIHNHRDADLNLGELSNQGTIINDGRLTVLCDRSICDDSVENNAGGLLINNGTFRVLVDVNNNDGSTLINNSTLILEPNLAFVNHAGAVLENNSQLTINAGNDGLTGRISEASALINAGTLTNIFQLTNNGILSNSGTLNNRFRLTNNATLENAGTLTNTFRLTNNGTLENTGTINNHRILTNNLGATFSNDGTIVNHDGAKLSIDGEFTNNVNGVLINNAGADLLINRDLSNLGRIVNASLLTNQQTLENWGSVSNTGTLVNDANLANRGGTFTNDGLLTNNDFMRSAATLINNDSLINNATLVLQSSGRTDNNGTLTNNFGATLRSESLFFDNNGTFNNNGTLVADGHFTNRWHDDGDVREYATLNNNFGATLVLEDNDSFGGGISELSNFGRLMNAGGVLTIKHGARLDNNGEMNNSGELSNAGTLVNYANATAFENQWLLNNTGTLANEYASRFTNHGALNNTGAVENRGVFEIAAGGLVLGNGRYSQFDSTEFPTTRFISNSELDLNITLVNGTLAAREITISTGTLSGTGTLFVNPAAALTVNGVGAKLAPGASLGSGPKRGAICRNKSCNPTANGVGTLTLLGDYVQGPSGTFAAEIDATGADLLDLAGFTASLDGTLNVALIGGFMPSLGDVYTLLLAESIIGTFASVELPTLADLWWELRVGESSVELAVLAISGATESGFNVAAAAPVPLPPALWLAGSALLGLFGVSRRKPSAIGATQPKHRDAFMNLTSPKTCAVGVMAIATIYSTVGVEPVHAETTVTAQSISFTALNQSFFGPLVASVVLPPLTRTRSTGPFTLEFPAFTFPVAPPPPLPSSIQVPDYVSPSLESESRFEANSGTVSANFNGHARASYTSELTAPGLTKVSLNFVGGRSSFESEIGFKLSNTLTLTVPETGGPDRDYSLINDYGPLLKIQAPGPGDFIASFSPMPFTVTDDAISSEDFGKGVKQQGTAQLTPEYVLDWEASVNAELLINHDILFSPEFMHGTLLATHESGATTRANFSLADGVIDLDFDLYLAGQWDFSITDLSLSAQQRHAFDLLGSLKAGLFLTCNACSPTAALDQIINDELEQLAPLMGIQTMFPSLELTNIDAAPLLFGAGVTEGAFFSINVAQAPSTVPLPPAAFLLAPALVALGVRRRSAV